MAGEWYEAAGGDKSAGYRQTPPERNGFATASVVCGLASCLLIITGILPIPLGALGILFSILATRKGKPKAAAARAGLIMSLIGMVMGLVLSAYSVYVMVNDADFRQQVNALYSQMYGGDMSFEEFLERSGLEMQTQ